MGPEETALRRQLSADGGLSAEDEARLGPVARFRLNDYLRKGIAYRGGDGRPRLKVYKPDPRVVAEHQRALVEKRQLQAQLAERQRLAVEAAIEKARIEQAQRALFAGTEYLSSEQRRMVVDERLAVLKELKEHGDGEGEEERQGECAAEETAA